jgi:hypothetical protein
VPPAVLLSEIIGTKDTSPPHMMKNLQAGEEEDVMRPKNWEKIWDFFFSPSVKFI